MRLRDFERTLPESQRWENLTLANDFMFGRIMRDPELCTEMIRRILPDMNIGHVEFTQPQKSSKYSLDTRGVRFDVYAESDNRKIFDCEVQTTDKKDLPRRTRAYHSILGMEALEKERQQETGKYNDMPDAFVIFICMFDPFDYGRHYYSFCNMSSEVDGLKLNDGTATIFLNAKGQADDINGELKAFLDFMLGKTSDDPFIMRLEERLDIAKLNAKERRNYMLQKLYEWERDSETLTKGIEKGIVQGIEIGRTQGIEIGRAQGIEIGRADMFNSVIEFMKLNGMSEEKINNLRASIMES